MGRSFVASKLLVSVLLLAGSLLSGEGFEVVAGGLVGFWLREGEHQTLRRVPRG